jgi:hypothetical protein
MDIVNFEQKHYEGLLAFSKRVWPKKSEEYLKYRLFSIPEQTGDNRFNLLVINDDGEIVGCALYIPTKARINDKEEMILWSHDMIVEDQYRGAAGLLLIMEMFKNRSTFGFGVSDINFKIQKELGANFIGLANLYLIFNIWSFKLLLYKLRLMKKSGKDIYNFPAKLKVGKYKFTRISNVNELNIPNNGYWIDGNLDIDFVRDEHFFRNRFFENFNKYYFYNLEFEDSSKPNECYFVVRPVNKRGLMVLSIVDFRFNFRKPEQFKSLVRAGAKLGRLNRIALVSLLTSFKHRRINLYTLIKRKGSQQHILTYYPVNSGHNVLVTSADSDMDFISE